MAQFELILSRLILSCAGIAPPQSQNSPGPSPAGQFPILQTPGWEEKLLRKTDGGSGLLKKYWGPRNG